MEKPTETRRRILQVGGTTAVTTAIGGAFLGGSELLGAQTLKTLRWGVVGTGGIANSMANMIKLANASELGAVSSRRLTSARSFADKHGVPAAYDSWQAMIDAENIDAIYVATPTSVREEICIAAAKGGKHVLGEKPFASAASVKRIVAACRANDVAFMDGTHFVHHPRTHHIQKNRDAELGFVWSVASAFQFNLGDRGNIRYNPELEPMGAIGDAGWYNMRAAYEYLSPNTELVSVSAHLRRDQETGAALSGTGVLDFADGSTSTWNCGFDSGAVVMDLRVTGTDGVVTIDNFLSQNADASADFLYKKGGWGGGESETINIASTKPGAALMFEDMAAAAGDPSLRDQWMIATERTQALLDAAWEAAIANE